MNAPGHAETWPRVGVTSHRDVGRGAQRWLENELARVFAELQARHNAETLITGMAIGADLIAAEAATSLGLAVWAYLPFGEQTQRWPHPWVLRHQQVMGSAAQVRVAGQVAPASDGRRARVALLHKRNRMIVADANILVAVWDRRTSGGTYRTVRHAAQTGLPVITVNPAARETTIRRAT